MLYGGQVWHEELITFLPSQQNLFHKFDIATVIEQAVAKQKHVDHFCTYNELGSLVLYRSFQPEYQYAEYLSTVKCFSNRKLLSRFKCGCHALHVDTGRWAGTERKDRLCQVCHLLRLNNISSLIVQHTVTSATSKQIFFSKLIGSLPNLYSTRLL